MTLERGVHAASACAEMKRKKTKDHFLLSR